ncbi:MAG TPA: InlB B-repeat-containing protein, partial [Anaerolineales bacterium]|nr:InlB B-repeat-containing protein [Anaerolineales bacterium]
VYAEISLMYQPTSWEYIQFLYLANDEQSAFLGQEGVNMLDTWLNTGMAEPEVMATAEWGGSPPEQYTLTVNVTGSGAVTQLPDQANYNPGEEVTLTAVPAEGWSFAGWSDDLSGSVNPEAITMDGNKTVTATFTQDTYTLTVNIVGDGSVRKTPDQTEYSYGDEVELRAFAGVGSQFDHWSGDISGGNITETITMDGNKTVTAFFSPSEYLLTINIVGSGGVSASPDSEVYYYNSVVELTANPDPGWVFVEWSGDLTGSDNPDSLQMTYHKTVTATFVEEGTCPTPVAPSLLAPVNNGYDNSPPLQFHWDSAENANEYQIQVDTDPAFSDPTIWVGEYSPYFSVISENDTYYWRVRGHYTLAGCDVYGPWSEVWNVGVDTFAPNGGFAAPLYNGDVLLLPRTYLDASFTDAFSGVSSVTYSAYYSGAWHPLHTDSDGTDGWKYLWSLIGIPEQTIQLRVVGEDYAGNQRTSDLTGISLQSTMIFGNGYETRGGRDAQSPVCKVVYHPTTGDGTYREYLSWTKPTFFAGE